MFSAALPVTVTAALTGGRVDLAVVPIFEADDLSDLPDVRAALGEEWSRARAAGELAGKPFDIVVTPAAASFGAARLALVGAGPREGFDGDLARRVAAAGALAARQRRAPRIAVYLRGLDPGASDLRAPARIVQAAAEGLTLAQFDTATHKSTPADTVRLEEVAIVSGDYPLDGLQAAADRGRVLAESTNVARALGNEPPNLLTPRVFAERAVAATGDTGLAVEVLDERAIADLGMGLLLGVAQGSHEPPRLIVLRHEPAAVTDGPVLGFVGKGITFDTGGISIKPADGMDRMKVDMAGGAAVIGALRALALLRAPVRAIGIVPSTENMPGGRAMRPGDVLRAAEGKTVEVLNTDAEGRLILGDALWYARHLGATHLVDVATLTGACVVALGRHASGLFGRPDEWVEQVRQAARDAGERCWPMPTWDEYFEALKSEIADMTNTGGRPGGAVTAALFLKQFAGDGAWAHLDIAGTGWIDDAKPWQQKGASGTATRTLVELALAMARR
jgi:leucyl aminopeptidase